MTTDDVPAQNCPMWSPEGLLFLLCYLPFDHHVHAGSISSRKQLARSYAGAYWSSIASTSRPTTLRRHHLKDHSSFRLPGLSLRSFPSSSPTDRQNTVHDMSSVVAETSRCLAAHHSPHTHMTAWIHALCLARPTPKCQTCRPLLWLTTV